MSLTSSYSPREWLEYDYRVWSYVQEVECREAPRYWITDLSTISNKDLIKEIDKIRARVLSICRSTPSP